MMLVDKETGKGYVEMEKVHRDKKEYASKAVGGTALGLSIGALGLQLLGGGLLNCGLFGNRATVAETAAIAGTARPAQPQQVNLWYEIDKEVCSLNND